MAYWSDIRNQAIRPNNENVNAYAALVPEYDQQSPQYPYPSPYNLAQQGYRLNEVVYACIEIRQDMFSEPPISITSLKGKTPQKIEDHPLTELLENPCEGVTQKTFKHIIMNNLLTAGFTCWEKERNNMGDVIHLWPMRPDWCSFMGADGHPVDRVRYQPYGLPYIDIPRNNVFLVQYYDPMYPLRKGIGPTAIGLRDIGVDNAATDYLKIFFQQGSVISGLLTTEQSLADTEGERIRQLWAEKHGGSGNWGANNIGVVGKGLKYQTIGMNFKDMAFQEIDGRTESRLCMVYKVKPILVGAKVGLTASTYSNYEQARKAQYEETATSDWQYIQDEIEVQLLPDFEKDPESFNVEFDTSKVRALQDDRDKQFTRAVEAAKANLVTRDEGRAEIGLDPIDNAPVFIGVTVRAMDTGAGASGAPGTTTGGAVETTSSEIVGDQPQDQAASEADISAETKAMSSKDFASDDQRRAFFGTHGGSGGGSDSSGSSGGGGDSSSSSASGSDGGSGGSGTRAADWRNLPSGHPDRIPAMRKELQQLKDQHAALVKARRNGVTRTLGNNRNDFPDNPHNPRQKSIPVDPTESELEKLISELEAMIENEPMDEAIKAARDFERKQFHQFAMKRKKEGHPEKMREFKFMHLTAGEQAALLTEVPANAWRSYP